MTAQHYQTSAICEQRVNPCNQREIAEIVGPELDFENIHFATERRWQ